MTARSKTASWQGTDGLRKALQRQHPLESAYSAAVHALPADCDEGVTTDLRNQKELGQSNNFLRLLHPDATIF